MTWNYRIMRRVEGRGTTHYYSYGIHEVFTRPKTWTEDDIAPIGDTPDELRRTYDLMAEAFKAPILDFATGKQLPKRGSK